MFEVEIELNSSLQLLDSDETLEILWKLGRPHYYTLQDFPGRYVPEDGKLALIESFLGLIQLHHSMQLD